MARVPLFIGGDVPGQCAGCMLYEAYETVGAPGMGAITGYCRLFKATIERGAVAWACRSTTRDALCRLPAADTAPHESPSVARPADVSDASQVSPRLGCSDLKGAVTYGCQANSEGVKE